MQCDGYPMNEFVMKKMEDRPPCYDDIGDDRIASPEIPDSYDKAPITNSYDEVCIISYRFIYNIIDYIVLSNT